jgi:ubiquinone/menaquinone biosynthesis C-methylase UbiE
MTTNPEPRYPIDAENAAEMARLTKQSRQLTELLGLFPEHLNISGKDTLLDIGCGPGEWALAVAQHYPAVQVTGIDISRIMVDYAHFGARTGEIANARFLVMDARQPLQFPDASFDLVHTRFISGFMSPATWPALLAECVRVARPGGIICSTEGENMGIITTPALAHYNTLYIQAVRQAGQCFDPEGPQYGITAVQARLLTRAGVTRLQNRAAVLNYSAGTPANAVWYDNYRTGMKLLQPFLIRSGLVNQQEIDLLYEQALEEMRREDFCALFFFLSVWGEVKHAISP